MSEQHDPLCSEGVYIGDQRMPCDCRLARMPPAEPTPPAQAVDDLLERLRQMGSCNCNRDERDDGTLPHHFVRHANWCNSTRYHDALAAADTLAQMRAERDEIEEQRDRLEDLRFAAELRAEGARLRCERAEQQLATVRAALVAVTEHMDRAGGDRDGMPECPWCKAGPHGDDHAGDCELVAARAALAPPPPEQP